MKRYFTLLCLVVLCFISLQAENRNYQLSQESEISLLTCEPGPEIYAHFGHTALRINDPILGIDWVFHYGVFNLYEDNFLAHFLAGRTYYQLGRLPMSRFMPEYIERGSSVYAQTLDLTLEEKQHLFDALWTNYQPEHRQYLYNFVFDNCATRPFKLIEEYASPDLHFQFKDSTSTYRTLIGSYIGVNNWLSFGINMLLGREADFPVGDKEAISFPLQTKAVLEQGRILTSQDTIPLVKQTTILYQAPPQPKSISYLSPLLIGYLFLILTTFLTYIRLYKGRYYWGVSVAYFLLCGLVGILITYMAFCSLHPLVQDNYNLFWLSPLHFIYGLSLLIPRWRNRPTGLSVLVFGTGLIAFVLFAIQYQDMHPAALPFILSTILYSLPLFKKKEKTSHDYI